MVFKLIDSGQSAPSPDEETEKTVSQNERQALINLKRLVKDVGVS
jgi:hypothetical protein